MKNRAGTHPVLLLSFACKTKSAKLAIGILIFIVCVEYWDALRVFQFSSTGDRLGAKNFDPPFEVKKEIAKKSTLIDKFPRKHPF